MELLLLKRLRLLLLLSSELLLCLLLLSLLLLLLSLHVGHLHRTLHLLLKIGRHTATHLLAILHAHHVLLMLLSLSLLHMVLVEFGLQGLDVLSPLVKVFGYLGINRCRPGFLGWGLVVALAFESCREFGYACDIDVLVASLLCQVDIRGA